MTTPPYRIRPARPEDAPDVVALRALVYPYLVRGVESTRRRIAEPVPGGHEAVLVAEVAGTVVGWVAAYRNRLTAAADLGEIATLHVHPDHRRRGIGTALLTRALDHLAPLALPRTRLWALAEWVPFAEKHGFPPSRSVRYSALDLTSLAPPPQAPAGARLLRLAEVEPRRLHAAHLAASVGKPGDAPADGIDYPTWHHLVWSNLDLDHAASSAVEIDGAVASFSLVVRNGDRMTSDMTATLPAYRGRGLARLVKLTALHRAREVGANTAYTSNDEANAPMLAVNERLGYRPVATQWSCLR
ncbi:GNAT family N-acetyltransferase [Micromonospora cathayae]|uniref:GNAT family N-acetyltransferase n=1 Tax=Micromonospora cathayae TaxID=3028804 RepID=A0ABY7ZRF1_9ACTN|nr:GNAT family N-acetyltransferase [Micromonospora sp. HUAS 3]WDZ85525.1 GNAT family N-acetyltransferase [Micromonospora sp. HUAS 3]